MGIRGVGSNINLPVGSWWCFHSLFHFLSLFSLFLSPSGQDKVFSFQVADTFVK